MKLGHLIYESPAGRILLVVLAILFSVCVKPAYSASEPGTVTIVLEAEPRSVDPMESGRSVEGQILMKNVLESLTNIDSFDSSISPALATSWKQIDALTWHFSLRKGVKFHDGEDFNAEAVVFNVNRLYDKRVFSHALKKFFGGVRLTAKALDSHTVEIKSDVPEPVMLTKVGLLSLSSPNTPMDKWTHNPIGTGPMKFIKWDAGTQIVLERFDGYWGKKPQVEKAVYLFRSESSVRAAMIAAGEADFTPNIAVQDANDPQLDIPYLNSETAFLRIGGNWDPPFNDRRFRMALNYAIDLDALRGSILSKDVVPATCLVVPGILGHNPDLKPWPYDPQKAKQLLADARKDGVPVDKEILVAARIGIYPGYDEVAEACFSMFKAVGLNVKLQMIEQGRFKAYDNKPYAPILYIAQRQHNNSYGDAGFTAFYNYHSEGGNSVGKDAILDYLIETAQTSTGEKRKVFFQEAFKRIQEDVIPNVLLFHMVAYARKSNRINFKPSLATNGEIPMQQITFNK